MTMPLRRPHSRTSWSRLGLTETLTIPGMMLSRGEFRPAVVHGVEIELADNDEALAEACEVMTAGFEMPPDWFRAMYRRELVEGQATVYLLRAGGCAVATAVAVTRGDAVGVFNVATPEAYRGHGYGSAVTSRAVADGLATGARGVHKLDPPANQGIRRRDRVNAPHARQTHIVSKPVAKPKAKSVTKHGARHPKVAKKR